MIIGDPLPPERVAAGWALGMFIGCSIPFGVQLVVSIPLAIYARVSKVGASVGTFITNPITIFFIYPAQTLMAGRLLGFNMSWKSVCESMKVIIENRDWNSLFGLSGEIVVCFLLGGVLLAVVLSPLTYFVVKKIVVNHRKRRGNLV